ncbi:MAG: M28 family peptidase [Richelia sp. CSU_2_1]|nr:M28 family peptidase [Richelia sp. CSU_2_1]
MQKSNPVEKIQWSQRLVILGIILFAVAIALWQLVPPNVIPATAPLTEFSADRAMSDLKAIAQAPHPIGSAAHAAVREYLMTQLKAMGLQPEIQTTTVVQPGDGGFGAGRVNNVLVRIPGTASTGAIVLDGHYDAADTGPGASDCGSCVVTGLETLRAIRAGTPLNNDLIFVFADGEEVGMLGARAFVTEHPWAKDVKLAINFEASGSRGAAVMYITSRNNQRLISEFVKTVPYPRMNSFSTAFWGLLPGAQIGCDLEEYIARGSGGFGFYYAGDTPAYHTLRDHVTEIDRRSIQHNGSYALALLKHFGNLDLKTLTATQNAVYFNILPNVVVHYPEAQVLPLAVVTSLLFIAVVWCGFRARKLTLKGIGLGAIAFFLSAIGVMILAILSWWLMRSLNPSLQVFLIGNYQANLYHVSFVVLTVATMMAIYTGLYRRFQMSDLAIGALVVWLLLAIASSAWLPGASYLFAIPLLFILLAWSWILLTRNQSWIGILLLSVAIVPGIILFLPVQVYFGSWMARFEGLMNVPLSTLQMFFTVLLCGLLIPQFSFFTLFSLPATRLPRWIVPVSTLLIGTILLSIATFNSGFSATHPRPNTMSYLLDADRGQASWVSSDRRLDLWKTQIMGAKVRQQQVEFGLSPASSGFIAPAHIVNLPALEVERLDSSTSSSKSTLRLRLKSPRQASIAYIDLTTQGTIERTQIDRKSLELTSQTPKQRKALKFIFFGLPPEGIELTLELTNSQSVQMKLEDYTWGLPAISGKAIAPRPADLMPAPGHPDYTIVRKQVTITI